MNNNSDKYTENYLIDFSSARQLVYQHSDKLPSEPLPVCNVSGRVLAKEVVANISIPSFDNSAMDGYAVNAADLKNATPDNPASLKVIGLTAAGDMISTPVDTQNCAWKIMTGASLPSGFDSVIAVEDTRIENDKVLCFVEPVEGAHIRRMGEDFVKGERVSLPGKWIDSNAMMAYSALGIQSLTVQKNFSVAIFSTGKELVDDPAVSLKPGQIYNSNKTYLLDWFKNLPVKLTDAGTNHDQPEQFERDLKNCLQENINIIISSGAVSMGDFDFIPQTIIKLGGNIIFHKSKIRPGKPILFAKFPNGSLYFGLPGNPISAAIGLRFFVGAAINKLLGQPLELPCNSIAANPVTKKAGFRAILKAHAKINSMAQHQVEILQDQQSFKIKPLLNSNGWALISEELAEVKAGDRIEFYSSYLQEV